MFSSVYGAISAKVQAAAQGTGSAKLDLQRPYICKFSFLILISLNLNDKIYRKKKQTYKLGHYIQTYIKTHHRK